MATGSLAHQIESLADGRFISSIQMHAMIAVKALVTVAVSLSRSDSFGMSTRKVTKHKTNREARAEFLTSLEQKAAKLDDAKNSIFFGSTCNETKSSPQSLFILF